MYISSWVKFHSQYGIQASVCLVVGFFFGKVLNHMIRQSNFLVCFLSSFLLNGWAFLTEITTAMCARICLKYGPVKIEIRFLSLKAALILHIFWDLEDFSWTDSKWSSFSFVAKDLSFPSSDCLLEYTISSSLSSPSIIAQLSAAGSSHSFEFAVITNLEYLYSSFWFFFQK